MKDLTCTACQQDVDLWNTQCDGCGYRLVLEPDSETKAKFLRRPALGALLFTQGWAFGARLYGWMILSFIPILGFVALGGTTLFGRRMAWKRGAWKDWDHFVKRMRLLDGLAIIWILVIIGTSYLARNA